MKLMLVQAKIPGVSAPVLRWRIRHHRVLAFVGRKPATVEIGPVVKCTVFCALADGFDVTPVTPSSTSAQPGRPPVHPRALPDRRPY
jgi:hypothetical protein